MELAKITSKGQLTLPVSLRRKFGIETGDQLLFYECDGRIILAPVTPATLADAQEAAARQHIYTLDEIRKITVPIAERYRLKKLCSVAGCDDATALAALLGPWIADKVDSK